MAKIRHVAFISREPQQLSAFYQQVFGFEQVYLSASGSTMVADPRFNLAFLKQRGTASEVVGTHRADGAEADQRLGINHFGFIVDSVDEMLSRLGSTVRHGQNPQDGRPAEMRVIDRWGNNFDLSARGYFGREEQRLPGVRQVVLQADSPEEVAEFFKSNLDLREVARNADGSVVLSDGDVSFTVVQEGPVGKRGIQYIGIQVSDLAAVEARLRELGRAPAPASRPGEIQIEDPEGNLLVLSQSGWQS